MLRTKLHRPSLGPDLVKRDYLIRQLDQNSHKPLVLISAPSGYGKSILVSQWIEACKVNAAWLSLDSEHQNFRVFLEYFVSALQSIIESGFEQVMEYIKRQQLPPVEKIYEALIGELDQVEDGFVIVLDDYQVINDYDLHELINLFILYPVEKMQLAILCRRDPPLKINHLRLYNRINEIRMTDLAFNLDDTKELVKRKIANDLTDEELGKIYNRTEGWVLGLQMLLMTNEIQTINANVQPTSHYSLTEYSEFFTEIILKRYSDEFRLAIYIASLLERFNAEILDTLFGKIDSIRNVSGRQIIQDLMANNLFIYSLDKERIWFRFHHFFNDLLLKQMHIVFEGDQIDSLYICAVNWFEEQQLIDEAVAYAAKVKAWDLAAQIIVRNRHHVFEMEYFWQFERWVSHIPHKYQLKYPEILLTRLVFFDETFQMEEMERGVEQLDTVLLNHDNERLRAEQSLHKGFINVRVKCEPLEAIKNFEHASLIKDDTISFFYNHSFNFALAMQMAGKREDSFQFLSNIRDKFVEDNLVDFSPHIKAIEFFLYALSGDFNKALVEGNRYYEFLKENDKRITYPFLWSCYMAGNAAFQLYELESAALFFDKIISNKELVSQLIAIDAFAGYAIVLKLRGEEEKLTCLISDFKLFIKEHNIPNSQKIVDACNARLHFLDIDEVEAILWARSEPLRYHINEFHYNLEVPVLTRIRILVQFGYQKEIKSAIEALEDIKKDLERVHNAYHLVDVLVLRSMALSKINQYPLAKDEITKALILAKQGGGIRAFMEMGEPLLEILEKVIASESATEIFKDHLIHQIETNIKTNQNLASNSSTKVNAAFKLSSREKEVIRILSSGLRNQEIAEELNISLETVKSHVKNCLKKMKAKNRLELVRIVNDKKINYPDK